MLEADVVAGVKIFISRKKGVVSRMDKSTQTSDVVLNIPDVRLVFCTP